VAAGRTFLVVKPPILSTVMALKTSIMANPDPLEFMGAFHGPKTPEEVERLRPAVEQAVKDRERLKKKYPQLGVTMTLREAMRFEQAEMADKEP
jgi:hypothetical protein